MDSLAYYVTMLRKDFSQYCSRELSAVGLSPGQLYFILYVGRHPGCTPKVLAQALRMDMGHTIRTLAKLEAGGFLVQSPKADDRRAHELRLTEQGEAAFALSHVLFAKWDDAALGGLQEAERAQLLALLGKVVEEKGRER